MNPPLDLLKVVALTEDLPEAGLLAGQVGTVGEKLADGVLEVGCRKMGGKRGRDLEFRIWSQFPPATSALRMAGLISLHAPRATDRIRTCHLSRHGVWKLAAKLPTRLRFTFLQPPLNPRHSRDEALLFEENN
jgi:Domain of unknown function (DUF4926)